LTMRAPKNPEYLHVVAFGKRWQSPSEELAEPVAPEDLAEWQLPEKGVLVTEDTSPPMAEVLLALEVRPGVENGEAEPEDGDSEAEEG